MALWVFGDSFAELDVNTLTWAKIIASNLKTDLINTSINGCGIDWLSLKWDEAIKEIKNDDYLIILVPFPDRVCFWPDIPSISGISSIENIKNNSNLNKKISSQEVDAFEKYFQWLHTPVFNQVRIKSWLYWIDNFSKVLIHKPVILHTTNFTETFQLTNCETASGNLLAVSRSEFQNEETWIKLTSASGWVDPRVGHFNVDNHTILGNKILNFWRENIPINLEQPYASKIV
jgi:hypothetical protein